MKREKYDPKLYTDPVGYAKNLLLKWLFAGASVPTDEAYETVAVLSDVVQADRKAIRDVIDIFEQGEDLEDAIQALRDRFDLKAPPPPRCSVCNRDLSEPSYGFIDPTSACLKCGKG